MWGFGCGFWAHYRIPGFDVSSILFGDAMVLNIE